MPKGMITIGTFHRYYYLGCGFAPGDRVTVEKMEDEKIVITKADGSEELASITNNSAAHDWIVYTNAKLNHDFLNLN